ncbi:helix-turn-helix domain-containing protein [Neobacillus sp. KR4-4]|uniref:helix-turn-helix domain-containing protein n=1 Tax=Neobacillus sp. KR4-4 TaxID=3344872 RepID=UPI0035CBB4C1
MENFINNTTQPFTTFMNDFLQKRTIFEKSSTKLTYMYLFSLRNCSMIFPSHETIAVATCSSPSTVKRTLKELEKLGLLEVRPRPGFTSVYVLNDYREVVQNELDHIKLVQNEPTAQVKMNCEVVQNEPLKLKNKNKTIKNKNSSRELIENQLKDKYTKAPFEEVKEQVLNDDTLIIETDNQYKSILEYRLKNWKRTKVKNKPVRKELLPSWFNNNEEVQVKMTSEEIKEKKAAILDKLKKFNKRD